ncbi:MAG: GNAT family N-acetyltransferase [Kluyvera sp.]|uniref:GNAT family N-acetyltransferase n=1 Tax=Kluyvera sp. TaxID=1538228 RepID=UPI003F3BF8FF
MSIKHRFMGWTPCSFEEYASAYFKYGGSINMHPDIVRFFIQRRLKRFTFWQYQQDGEILAAYFVVDDKTIGLRVRREYPVSFDEVLFPAAPACRFWLPESAKRLSPRHQHHIRNASYVVTGKRQVCHVKTDFSAKTIKKRNGEFRRFLAQGGSSCPLAELSSEDIAQLYVHLFKRRFRDTVRCYEREKMIDLLSSVRHLITGNLLSFNGIPCAIDIVLSAESNNLIYSDVPNGGVEPDFAQYSPGSLLMWKNISDARQWRDERGKEMVFSIGGYAERWNYKLLWADALRTGRSLSI